MSKMSQLHAELSEQASQLGFQSIEKAEANGYEIDYEKKALVDGRELAHEKWLKEKEEILKDLEELKETLQLLFLNEWVEVVDNTTNFIKKGEI